MSDIKLILASASPRRIELLERLSLVFEVEPAAIDESVIGNESPAEYVERLASTKARCSVRPDAVVLAADTAVVVDGAILGKPTGADEAAGMLRQLSGRSHEVLTGVAVIASTGQAIQRTASAIETTSVGFTEISERRVRWYVETGEWADKAGGYALQGAGALFADQIEGSYTNVIGLPLPLLDRLFTEIGHDLISFSGPV